MNNLYRKVAVASVCTALGFALAANKEAEAATFSNFDYYWLASELTFHAIDGGSYGSFDGLGDTVTNVSYGNDSESSSPHSWGGTERTDAREVAALLEFSFSRLAGHITGFRSENAKITSITNAVLRIGAGQPTDSAGQVTYSAVMGAFGYVGNGIPEASDFEAGVLLDSKGITGYADWYDFNVTPFVQEMVSNNNEFAGFALRSLNQGAIFLPRVASQASYPPRLIVSGEIEEGVEPEPVPEPTTIFGSVIGLCLGGWLKRKKSSSQNKTTSQD
ncbi:PEP-CTERM sorting domain-containing protein [Microcoleus sp. herbarium2]|uniref:PEP-CTERM sorting domain-containing protein n=1 Tax=Microcoleus sp. herbarium2 TaxID=3055433 RepID=UPI002FD093DB